MVKCRHTIEHMHLTTPTQTVEPVSHDDLLWLAGWWEGEGCFSGNGQLPRMQVSCSDKDVIERAARILGVSVKDKAPHASNKRKCYYLSVNGHRARVWMLRLLPLMGERRQAKIVELLSQCPPEMVLAAAKAMSA